VSSLHLGYAGNIVTSLQMPLKIVLASVLLLIFIVVIRDHALSDRQWHWVALATFAALFVDCFVNARKADRSALWVTRILPTLSAGLATLYEVYILLS
jgi:hypothetical protein